MKRDEALDLGNAGQLGADAGDGLGDPQAGVEHDAVGALERRIVASGKPRRFRPTVLRPCSVARSPVALQNGGTSCDTIDPAPTIADSPMRTNWWMPARAPEDDVVLDGHVPAELHAVGDARCGRRCMQSWATCA